MEFRLDPVMPVVVAVVVEAEPAQAIEDRSVDAPMASIVVVRRRGRASAGTRRRIIIPEIRYIAKGMKKEVQGEDLHNRTLKPLRVA